jgi:selenium metabolism protein YedF
MKKKDTLIIVNNDGMGSAEKELTTTLIQNYFKLLLENDKIPVFICFYANGVKLVVEGSAIIENLKALEEKGTRIIICKTCLNFYQLIDKVKVGTIGTMNDIIELQFAAEKVITL